MFPYLNTNKHFLDQIKSNKLVDKLKIRVDEANWSMDVSSAEVTSWKNSLCIFMNDVLKGCDKNLVIGLEYYIGVGQAKRVDMMIGGIGVDGRRTILVVELKQWDTDLERQYNWQNPAEQVSSYVDTLYDINDETDETDSDKIRLIPVLYMHNMDINDVNYSKSFPDVIHICKNGMRDKNGTKKSKAAGAGTKYFRELIKTVFSPNQSEDKARAVFRQLRKGYMAVKTEDLVNILLDPNHNEGKYLRPDQQYVYEKMVGHLESDDKIVDVIYGGPTSGKSIIALMMVRYCMEQDKSVAFVYRGSAPKNAYKKCFPSGKKHLLYEVFWKDLLESQDVFDVVIFDEAQRLDAYDVTAVHDIIERGTEFVGFFLDGKQKLKEEDRGAKLIWEALNISKDAWETPKRYSVGDPVAGGFRLYSQFRCNRNDGYLTWVEKLLEIKQWKDEDGEILLHNLDYDAEVITSDKKAVKLLKEFLKSKDDVILCGYLTGKKEKEELSKRLCGIDVDMLKTPKFGNRNGVWDPDMIYNALYVQGVETEVAFVIINDLIYEDDEIKKKDNGDTTSLDIIKSRYRLFLTRGQKKCYIFCLDKGMQERLKDMV